MLLKSQLLSQYIKIGTTWSSLSGCPNKWNSSKNCFSFNPSTFIRTLIVIGLFGVSHSISIIFDIYQSRAEQGKKKGMDDRIIFGAIFFMLNLTMNHFALTMIFQNKLTEAFFNGLISLEKGFSFKNLNFLAETKFKLKFAKGICIFFRIMVASVSPFLIALTAVRMPLSLMNLLRYPPWQQLIGYLTWNASNSSVCEVAVSFIMFLAVVVYFIVILKACMVVITQMVVGSIGISQMIAMQLR